MKPKNLRYVRILRDGAAKGQLQDYTLDEQRCLAEACDKTIAEHDGQGRRRKKGRQ